MTTKSPGNLQMLGLSAKPAWAQTWHQWTVIIPRQSITGRLVFERFGGVTMVAIGFTKVSCGESAGSNCIPTATGLLFLRWNGIFN